MAQARGTARGRTSTSKKTAAPRKRTSGAGRSTRSQSPPVLVSLDPSTGKKLAEVAQTAPADVADIVAHARKVAPEWAAIHPKGRAHLLSQVRRAIAERVDDIVEIVSLENGKPKAEALTHDVLPTVLMLLYNEKACARVLKPQRIGRLLGPAVVSTSSYVDWRPYGVVGAIGPWNYPFFNTFLAFTSALFAGNCVVVKPSEVTPQVGELIKEILEPLPAGVATVIQGGADVGAALIDAPCDKISFIGSPATGRRICAAAAPHLTPVVMELGGKDAAIVCADADLDTASSGVLWGSFMNAGQTCCAIERTFVADEVADRFVAKLVEKAEKLRQGTDGDIGAITFGRQLEIVQRHVDDAVEKGGRILLGGPKAGRKNSRGSQWYAPTIVDEVTDDMAIVQEESFGPVVTITRYRDEREAVERANSRFNLTASVWSRDAKRADRLAGELKAGTVTINSHGDSLGAPWAPWGGVGESGFGRLGGDLGLREFTVPVHVARNVMPRMKRVWWYPYTDEMIATIRAAVEVTGASGLRPRARAARTALRNVGAAIKAKL